MKSLAAVLTLLTACINLPYREPAPRLGPERGADTGRPKLEFNRLAEIVR